MGQRNPAPPKGWFFNPINNGHIYHLSTGDSDFAGPSTVCFPDSGPIEKNTVRSHRNFQQSSSWNSRNWAMQHEAQIPSFPSGGGKFLAAIAIEGPSNMLPPGNFLQFAMESQNFGEENRKIIYFHGPTSSILHSKLWNYHVPTGNSS